MRYKTQFPKGEEEPIEWDDILQHRNHRLLVEKIQQSNWEKAGRDWKVYLSQIDWGEIKEKPQAIEVEKQTANKFW